MRSEGSNHRVYPSSQQSIESLVQKPSAPFSHRLFVAWLARPDARQSFAHTTSHETVRKLPQHRQLQLGDFSVSLRQGSRSRFFFDITLPSRRDGKRVTTGRGRALRRRRKLKNPQLKLGVFRLFAQPLTRGYGEMRLHAVRSRRPQHQGPTSHVVACAKT